MASYRLFVALPLTDGVRYRLIDVQKNLRMADADVHWEEAEKLHVTLRFLGEVAAERVELVKDRLEAIAKSFSPFRLTFTGVGAFPSARSPRIIWVGATAKDIIVKLQSTIEACAQDLGMKPETREYHAHATLGRVRGDRNGARLTEALKTVTFEPIPQFCREIVLLRSTLGPEGSQYHTLHRFPLPDLTGEFHG